MTQFEFVSAFVSILFGMGLAHLLTGAIGRAYRGMLSPDQLAYSINTLVGLALNWWVLFLWQGSVDWSFLDFLVLVIWALSFFSLAVALYPPGPESRRGFESHRTVYLAVWLVALAIDVAQTALRDQLFRPWYYLLLIGHFAGLATGGIVFRGRRFHAVLAWYFPVSQLVWSLLVRNLID